MHKLTEEGRQYLKNGLPEKNILSMLPSTMQELSKNDNATVALSNAKKRGWIEIRNGEVSLTKLGEGAKGRQTEEEAALDAISNGGNASLQIIRELERRNLILEIKDDVIKKAREQLSEGCQTLTPELIKTGFWREANFREYNVSTAKRFYGGRKHFLKELSEEVAEILVGMGFNEMKGPLVESSFYNFDLLFMPQDHPGREAMDTFFVKNPHKSDLPSNYKKIAQVHNNGGGTGSRGWGYDWDPEVARENVMRTHTTSVTFRYLSLGIPIPSKYFSIDRVFRNETVDQTHLFEFHQIEGFVAADGLTLRNMMGIFKEFYEKLGVKKLKFKPVYNPYTEPSMEIYGYYEKLGKWVEMGNSGMFRPETLLPLGIKCPVIAWGLALERLAMLIHGFTDIRQVFGAQADIQALREARR